MDNTCVIIGKYAAVAHKNKKWTRKTGMQPLPPHASHPLVRFKHDGTADGPSVLRAIVNSAWSHKDGRITAVGTDAVHALYNLATALVLKASTPAIPHHIVNASLWGNRKLLSECRLIASKKPKTPSTPYTCDVCHKVTRAIVTYAKVQRGQYLLCPECFADYTVRGTHGAADKKLVPIALLSSCFRGHAPMTALLNITKAATRDGVMALVTRNGRHGPRLALQPLAVVGITAADNKKRAATSTITYWIIASKNVGVAMQWLAMLHRTTKKSKCHSEMINTILRHAADLTSRGRAAFETTQVSRVPRGDVEKGTSASIFCSPENADVNTIDTSVTHYLAYRNTDTTTTDVISAALAAVTHALHHSMLALHIYLVPQTPTDLPRTLEQFRPHTADAKIDAGHPAHVVNKHILFTNAEHITYEHIWHAKNTLGANTVILVGNVHTAKILAAATTANYAWKSGHTFWELATITTHGVQTLHDHLNWDAHDDQYTQDAVRKEWTANANTHHRAPNRTMPWDTIKERAIKLQFA
jgi:hypothetical protein